MRVMAVNAPAVPKSVIIPRVKDCFRNKGEMEAGPDLNPNYRPQTILSNTRVTALILLESIGIECGWWERKDFP